MKETLFISFSAGETSAYMTIKLLEQFRDWYNIIIGFANTGEENEKSLEFAHKCESLFQHPVIWMEAITNPKHGAGIKAKVVSYETASRNGEPFESMVAKHGIPNVNFPHCSRELKQYVMRAYMRSLGYKIKDYKTAIGYRADEIDRIPDKYQKQNLYFPLVKWGINKQSVNRFWRDMPFRLEIKGYEGNCKVCWKKSLRKHLTIAKESPTMFDNFEKWEKQFERFIPDSRKKNSDIKLPIRFFRNNLSVTDIKKLSEQPFELASDDKQNFVSVVQLGLYDYELDTSNGCVESCEVF